MDTPLWNLIFGYQKSQILFLVVRYGVPDLLKDGPKSAEEIVRTLKVHEEYFPRVLRAAANIGIFHRDQDTLKYSLNEMSKNLVEGPTSMKWAVLHTTEPAAVRAWSKLEDTVRDGTPAFESAHNGSDYFSWIAQNPESGQRFNKAMNTFSNMHNVGALLAQTYDLSGAKKLVDVGGGHGRLLSQILAACPLLHGVAFDLPHVVETRDTLQHPPEISSRMSFMGGSFFTGVPEGGDIYTLKHIIHDWPDAKALEILMNVKRSLNKGAKVLVLERVVQENITDPIIPHLDLMMLATVGAKERMEEDFSALFSQAGLKLNRVIPLLTTGLYIIEGENADE